MIRNATKCLALAGAVLLGSVIPAHATKYDGYVCSTSYNPITVGGTGQHGYVFIAVWSGPQCTGALVHSVTFCSTGATSASCAPNYLASEVQLAALNQSLVEALAHDMRIMAITDNTCGNPAQCGAYVDFRPPATAP